MKIVTKLNVLIVSVTGLLLAGYLYIISPEQFANGSCLSRAIECKKFDTFFALSISVPILIFSLLLSLAREQVYKWWAWFSIIFSVIYIYIVLSEESGRSDGFSPTVVQTTIFVWFIYSIISTLIISIQYFRHRNKK